MSMRTIVLPKMEISGEGYKSAEFAISFTKGPKVEEVRFLSGAEELRSATAKVAAGKFNVCHSLMMHTRLVSGGGLRTKSPKSVLALQRRTFL
jgi:hypothetical protein